MATAEVPLATEDTGKIPLTTLNTDEIPLSTKGTTTTNDTTEIPQTTGMEGTPEDSPVTTEGTTERPMSITTPGDSIMGSLTIEAISSVFKDLVTSQATNFNVTTVTFPSFISFSNGTPTIIVDKNVSITRNTVGCSCCMIQHTV